MIPVSLVFQFLSGFIMFRHKKDELISFRVKLIFYRNFEIDNFYRFLVKKHEFLW